MSALSCNSVRGQAAELGLGIVTGEERGDLLAHLGRCTSCQALVGEYASVADALLNLVPEAEPMTELTPSVLRATRPSPSRTFRRRLVAVAAAVALVAATAGGVTFVRWWSGTSDTGETTSAVLRSAPMIGSNSLAVGRLVATNNKPPALAVSVDYWVPDGHYNLELRPEAGSSTGIGTLDITNGRGAWTGRVPGDGQHLAVALVDASGNVICQGRLP